MSPGFLLSHWKSWGASNWDRKAVGGVVKKKNKINSLSLDVITSGNVYSSRDVNKRIEYTHLEFLRGLCYRNAFGNHRPTAEIKIHIRDHQDNKHR